MNASPVLDSVTVARLEAALLSACAASPADLGPAVLSTALRVREGRVVPSVEPLAAATI